MIRRLTENPALFILAWTAISILVAALFGLWLRATRRSEMDEVER